MDKYEYKIRANEIKELIECEEYVQAAEIADTIDWRRVKSVMMLCTISDLYKINRRYEDARDMLLLAYERRPGGRTICYSLCELSIKTGEFVQAIEYYKEYVQAASSPNDTGRYVLQYKLYDAQDVSLEERIAVLEKLKQCEYLPKWSYELAYLYHRIGLASRCVEECDEMILWFGDGKYVVKAMELKMLHQPLTPSQQEKYDLLFNGGVNVMQAAEPVQEEVYEETTDNAEEVHIAEQDAEVDLLTADTQIYPRVQDAVEEMAPETESALQEEELDIHVKTMDVGQYNTMNLQAELAEGLREVLAQEQKKTAEDSITQSIVAPMLEADTESLDYPEIDEVSVDDIDSAEEEIESSEVFFGETGEIGSLQTEQQSVSENALPELSEEAAIAEMSIEEQQETTAVPDATAELVMKQLRLENTGEIIVKPSVPILHVEPPKALAGVLSQESDGQLSLVMPEKESIEKQITGQISLDDILAEWERMKKENQEKREEQMRQHVMQQTGTMFTEFEASVRDGLLEQLERGKDTENADATNNKPLESDEVEELEEIIEANTDDEYWYQESEQEIVDEAEYQEPEEEIVEEAEYQEPEQEAVEEAEYQEPEQEAVEEAEYQEPEQEIVEEAEYQEPEQEAVEETEYQEAEQELSVEERYRVAVQELSEEPEYSGEVSEIEAEDSVFEQIAEREKQTEVSEESDYEYEVNEEAAPPVQQDRVKVRPLTREEKELFAPFIQSRAAREQLVKAIDSITLAAHTGNVIVTGEEGMDTLALAKNMIREIQATDSNFSGKVAKISGQALNRKDVAATLEQLKNGALIISKASGMNADSVNAMYKFLQKDSIGIVVVLEDTKKSMDNLLGQYEQLKESFTARMDVEALSNDMLVAFGKQYAREREYSIDELGVLALHTRIDELQTIDHVVTVVEVKEIVDEAIRHANRKTLGHFFDILFAKRYDEDDMIILSESDFV